MISLAVVDEIERLLSKGDLSQRKIARRVGVSRGTVNAIALGKRPDYRARQRERADDFVAPCGPPRRCPSCGAMVEMPCVACRVRAYQESRRRARREWPLDGTALT
jgi:hypothetical protein